MKRLMFLLALAAGPAWGQFQLYVVNGSIVQPVVHSYDFGSVAPGTSTSAAFEIANVSTMPATLDLLTLSGSGFSVATAGAPVLPVVLAPQLSVTFTVVFQASGTGNFSATLNSVGIAIAFTATVPAQLTYQWVTATGVQSLAAGPVNFGSAPVGQSPTIEVLLLNQTAQSLAVPSLAVTGSGFSLAGQPAAGATVKPAASTALEIQFAPTAAGTFSGALIIGGQSFAISGTGVVPALPTPTVTIATPAPDSDEQGTIAVNLSAAAQTSGTGTLTLAFTPLASIGNANDPAIALATGGRSAIFNLFIGQAQGIFGSANSIAFQTGTTAGTLTVTATVGANTAQQSIVILPAVVGVTAVQGVRSSSSVEVDLTGFDNTRTAGALSFTFFDAGGNALTAPVQANGSADFAAYFQNSAGGTFALKAVFPVVGDTSRIVSFQAMVTNSAGTSTSAKTNF